MGTIHINAEHGDFAEAILLPGDPLRAKFIAEQFLERAREVTNVRNMLGFTGEYRGMPVSAMGTGMGIPSASIYVTELMQDYGVQRLVRVGSCGAVGDRVALRDIIIATAAATDSGVNRRRYGGWDFAAAADFDLARAAFAAAAITGIEPKVGVVHSADLFYTPDENAFEMMDRMGVLAVEMEAAGIYGAAAERGRRALTILTASDHIPSKRSISSEDRERSLGQMVEIALEALLIDAS